MSYKEIVLNYIKTHDVPYHLKEDIEDGLQKCISDSEVYELILRINHRLNIANCFERGFRGHVPIRFADEIASYDILTVLNKTKKMKQGNRHKEKCCGNCHWFDNEDVYGVGWCSNNEHVSSCGQVCDEHESKR